MTVVVGLWILGVDLKVCDNFIAFRQFMYDDLMTFCHILKHRWQLCQIY